MYIYICIYINIYVYLYNIYIYIHHDLDGFSLNKKDSKALRKSILRDSLGKFRKGKPPWPRRASAAHNEKHLLLVRPYLGFMQKRLACFSNVFFISSLI